MYGVIKPFHLFPNSVPQHVLSRPRFFHTPASLQTYIHRLHTRNRESTRALGVYVFPDSATEHVCTIQCFCHTLACLGSTRSLSAQIEINLCCTAHAPDAKHSHPCRHSILKMHEICRHVSRRMYTQTRKNFSSPRHR